MEGKEGEHGKMIDKKVRNYKETQGKVRDLMRYRNELGVEILGHANALVAACGSPFDRERDRYGILGKSRRYAPLYDMLTQCPELSAMGGSGKRIYIDFHGTGDAETIRITGETAYGHGDYDGMSAEFPLAYLKMSPDEFKSLVDGAVTELEAEQKQEDDERAEVEREYRRWQYEQLKAEFEGNE